MRVCWVGGALDSHAPTRLHATRQLQKQTLGQVLGHARAGSGAPSAPGSRQPPSSRPPGWPPCRWLPPLRHPALGASCPPRLQGTAHGGRGAGVSRPVVQERCRREARAGTSQLMRAKQGAMPHHRPSPPVEGFPCSDATTYPSPAASARHLLCTAPPQRPSRSGGC